MLDFSGLQAVVTGGTGALGRAVVKRLLAAGALVHVPVYIPSELEGFSEANHDACRVYEGLDRRAEEDVRGAYGAIDSLYASIHVAGGFDMGPIEDTTLETWDHLMRLNASTCFLCCREAARALDDRGGRIVNVTAKPVLTPAAQMSAYAASKAAVAALTTTLSAELASRNVWVNAVVPSIIDTPANRKAMPNADHSAWPSPEDIAETIAFLASPQNAVTRGALVPVYGRS